MADPKVMAMTTQDVLGADGFTAVYGTGELHELGSLPPGVPYRLVVADDAMVASANPHAQKPQDAPVDAPKAEAKAAKSEAKHG